MTLYGSHTVQEAKHNPNPNPVMNYAKAAALMVVGRLCNGTLVARKWAMGSDFRGGA